MRTFEVCVCGGIAIVTEFQVFRVDFVCESAFDESVQDIVDGRPRKGFEMAPKRVVDDIHRRVNRVSGEPLIDCNACFRGLQTVFTEGLVGEGGCG